jgi:Tol biopolymer transport system component
MRLSASAPIRAAVTGAVFTLVFMVACSSSADTSIPTAARPTATREPLPSPQPKAPLSTVVPTASPTASTLWPQNRIAITSDDGSIYTVDPDGSSLFRVTEAPTELLDTVFATRYAWPVWSPDGQHLLVTMYTADAGGGFATALLRVSTESSENQPNMVYADTPGTQGIGGVPHFPAWRPDAGAISLIADVRGGLATFIVSSTGDFGPTVSNGGPVYMDWSHDGSYLLTHTSETLVLHSFNPEGGRTGARRIGNGSISYRTPDFSPVTNEYLYVEFVDGERSLFVGDPTSGETRKLITTGAASAFRWSPDGKHIAALHGSREDSYDSLDIISTENPISFFETADTRYVAFWWSPDGKQLLLVSPSTVPNHVALSVLDTTTHKTRYVGQVQPSDEMSFVLSYFDQYATDLQLWSPDSSQIVFAGFLDDRTDGSSSQAASDDSRIWVFDSTGTESPSSVGAGVFAAWSPN